MNSLSWLQALIVRISPYGSLLLTILANQSASFVFTAGSKHYRADLTAAKYSGVLGKFTFAQAFQLALAVYVAGVGTQSVRLGSETITLTISEVVPAIAPVVAPVVAPAVDPTVTAPFVAK